MSLALLHEDEALIAIDKPAGLLAVPGRGHDKQDCAFTRVRAQWPDALVVHRLDMATSGLLLFARGAEAQRRLSRAFAERQVDKHYVAVVDGRMHAPQGCIELPLAADWPRRPRQRVDPLHGRPSRTDWQVLHVLQGPHDDADGDVAATATRLALQPHTGRTHQLRVHLATIGHPILGDALYAPPEVQARSMRLLLHADALSLPHPLTGEPLRLRCATPF